MAFLCLSHVTSQVLESGYHLDVGTVTPTISLALDMLLSCILFFKA